MAFKKADRQRIIDGYLNETGRNLFVPREFIEWLSEHPEHECHSWFFAKDDAEAAMEYRIGLARRMASGLRIVAKVETKEARVLHITTREEPAYVSPLAGRRGGGGYYAHDPSDPAHQEELRRQGCSALRGWLSRYRGAFEAAGVDLTPLEEVASMEDVREAG